MNSTSTILIIEDAIDDYEACVAALTQDNNLANPIFRCETGDDALDYLRGQGKYRGSEPDFPCLVLLDLNLPGTDGREVLSIIKADPDLKSVPVVVMTSSKDQTDIDACYRHGANSYIVKPVDLDGFIKAIARLRDYWFQIVLLPAPKK
jgi:CheY-like chemotaxis protein